MEKKYLYAVVATVIIIVLAGLILYSNMGSTTTSIIAPQDNQPVSAALISQLRISNNVSNAVNVTQAINNRVIAPITNTKLNATPLTINGKPEFLYIGAEYCPYCAAERWAMVVTLLRFGNFTNLRYMTSSHTDTYPDTPTFTFYNSTYSSPYIVFVPVETTSNNRVNGTYPTLQTPNVSENNLVGTYDTGGSIPFIDIANKSVQVGASYNPQLILGGLNWTQVGAYVNNPSSLQSQAIVSTANLMTAQICAADGNQPQSVCGQPYVTKLKSS